VKVLLSTNSNPSTDTFVNFMVVDNISAVVVVHTPQIETIDSLNIRKHLVVKENPVQSYTLLQRKLGKLNLQDHLPHLRDLGKKLNPPPPRK
jgi:hypothetical protein